MYQSTSALRVAIAMTAGRHTADVLAAAPLAHPPAVALLAQLATLHGTLGH